jgi:hypothetical protein
MLIKLQNSIESFKQYLAIAKYNKVWIDKYQNFEDYCKNEIGIDIIKVFGNIKAKSVKMPEQMILSGLLKHRLRINLYLYALFILLKIVKDYKLWPNRMSFEKWIKSLTANDTFKVIFNILGGNYVERSRSNRDADYQEGESESKDTNKRAGERIYRKADRNKKRDGKKFLSGSMRRKVCKTGRAVASKSKSQR